MIKLSKKAKIIWIVVTALMIISLIIAPLLLIFNAS
nr:hypothetical protein [uncultured archaeon]